MSDQQTGKRILAYLTTTLYTWIDAGDVAEGAKCGRSLASQYLRGFDVPGYTIDRRGNNFMISRNGHAPRPAKPKPAAQPEPKRSSCLNCREPIVENERGVWVHQQGRARGCLFLATPLPSEAER